MKDIHNTIAYNYRMTNIQAGFLYDQLSDLQHILSLKNKLFENYDSYFKSLFLTNKIKKLEIEKNTIPSNWMYCIIINDLNYKDFENYMNEKLIQIRPFFFDIRKHQHLQDISVSYKELGNVYNPGLKSEQQEYIINCLDEYLKCSKKSCIS